MSRKRRKSTRAKATPRTTKERAASTNQQSKKTSDKPVARKIGALSLSPHPHNLYLILSLINVIVVFVWQAIVPLFGFIDYIIGFVVGFVAISAIHRPYIYRAYRLLYFIGYVVWQILLSNLSIAKLVLQPKPNLDPGIIAVPLTVSTGLEIMILASVITLTPGTISVDLGKNEAGQQVLYVHNLRVGDPEAFRQSIRDGFERLLLQVTRGTAPEERAI